MRISYQILMPLLSIFFVRVDLTDLFPLHLKVELVRIYDGDTVMVRHGSYFMRVRFALIDSPEKAQYFLSSKKSAGIYSMKCFERLLKKEKDLILKIEKEDIYGRILGDINDLSFQLISEGCTTLYPHAVFSSIKEKSKYLIALKKAKASRRNLWQYGGFMQPKLWRKISKLNVHRPSRR